MTHAENADNINEADMNMSARIRWVLSLLTGAVVLTLATIGADQLRRSAVGS